MKKILLFLNLLICVVCYSQEKPNLREFKNTNDKLKAWEIYCGSLSDNEKYSQLIEAAEKGIQLGKNNENFLGRFYYLKGYGYEYTNNQYEKAVYYYEKSLLLAQKTKNFRLETSDLMRLNYMYFSTLNEEKGRLNFEHIKKVADTIKDITCKATLYGSMGEYYQDRSQSENFVKYKLKAINLLISEKNRSEIRTNSIGVSYLQIADIYIDIKQYEKAIEYCKYAEPYMTKSDGIAYLYNSFIEAYTHLDDLRSAEKYYKKLYQFAIGKPLLYINLSYANRNMAEFYLDKNNLKTADDFANKALLFAGKSNDEEITMEANVIKGRVFFGKKSMRKRSHNLI